MIDPGLLHERIAAMRTSLPPPPWHHRATHIVGGLLEVGFSERSEHLMVISLQGLGVIDCRTGELVARERGDLGVFANRYDHSRHEALGIGPLDGEVIRVAGVDGGSLPWTTNDGWGVAVVTIDEGDHRVLLSPPGAPMFEAIDACTQIAAEENLYAVGFSHIGTSLVIATSSDLVLLGRILG